jgi:transposase-like protein
MTKRKQHKPEFKARVALEVLKGEQMVADLPAAPHQHSRQGAQDLLVSAAERQY